MPPAPLLCPDLPHHDPKAALIRRSLEDLARFVSLLPLGHQKELFQLLPREVEIRPFDPEGAAPPVEDWVIATKIRTPR